MKGKRIGRVVIYDFGFTIYDCTNSNVGFIRIQES